MENTKLVLSLSKSKPHRIIMSAAKIINTKYLIAMTNLIEIYLSMKSSPLFPPFKKKQTAIETREQNKNIPQSNHWKIEFKYEPSDKKGLLNAVSNKVNPNK